MGGGRFKQRGRIGDGFMLIAGHTHVQCTAYAMRTRGLQSQTELQKRNAIFVISSNAHGHRLRILRYILRVERVSRLLLQTTPGRFWLVETQTSLFCRGHQTYGHL